MSFFRHKPNLSPQTARLAREQDHAWLDRFIHSADRRFLTSDVVEAPGIFRRDPTALLEADGCLVAAASFGWRTPPVAWLRTLLIHGSISALEALRALSRPLHVELRAGGTRLVAITLDDWNEPWLRRPLLQLGYRPMVEVVGYQKQDLSRPASGNQVVKVRMAQPEDLQDVLDLDALCFPLPWVKGPEILAPALNTSPCFVVAAFGGELVGYAFVTGHQSGRRFHLVRIAVAPVYQGRGVGVRLLADIVDYCASRNAELLTLNTQADNYQAQRLYEWFGFTRTGDRQTVLGYEID